MDVNATLQTKLEEAKAKLANIRSQIPGAQQQATTSMQTSDKYLSDSPEFANIVQRQLMSQAQNLEPLEQAKNDALAKYRYVTDTDQGDLGGMNFGTKNAVLGQRAGDLLSKFYTNQDVIENIKGQINDMVGKAMNAYSTQATLADRQAGRYAGNLSDLRGQEAEAQNYYDTIEGNMMDLALRGGGGGGPLILDQNGNPLTDKNGDGVINSLDAVVIDVPDPVQPGSGGVTGFINKLMSPENMKISNKISSSMLGGLFGETNRSSERGSLFTPSLKTTQRQKLPKYAQLQNRLKMVERQA